jgi:peptidoglycan hydrolase-like protein with peptidoglycan-binding domain
MSTDDTDTRADTRARPVGRRRTVTLVVVGIALAGALAAGVLVVSGGALTAGAADEEPAAAAPSTAPVELRALQHQVTARGTISYESRGKLTTQRAGTVTTAPQVGTVLTPGTAVTRVDDVPVVVLRGALPAWRAFEPEMAEGTDVQQLEQALQDAGFRPGKVDRAFTSSTEAAVKSWQKAIGVEQSGKVALGDVVFLPEDLRVSGTTVAAGDRVEAGAQLGTLGAQSASLSVVLKPGDAERVHVEARASVTLPSGTAVPGTVVSVGPVRQAAGDTSGAGAGNSTGSTSGSEGGAAPSKAELPVSVRLDDPAAADGLDQSVVGVDIDAGAEPEGLVVPVAAVLAASRDSYAVQVVEKGVVTTRPVELGASEGGDVVVTSGLREGESVVVPS